MVKVYNVLVGCTIAIAAKTQQAAIKKAKEQVNRDLTFGTRELNCISAVECGVKKNESE